MKKTNEGYCAEIFEVGPQKLLKLYHPSWSEAAVRQEYEMTGALHELGVSSPAVYEVVERDGRYGFVMEKLTDYTMLHHIGKNLGQAFALARQLAELHFEIHSHGAPSCVLPTQKEVFLQKVQTRPSLSQMEKERIAAVIRDLPDPADSRVCHGDFHPMNILYQGDTPVVIDWAFAYGGDPRSDVAGTYMITKIMATMAGARSRMDRFMFKVFTPVFAEIYLREYRKLSGYSRREIIEWIPIRAATYLDLRVPEKANRKLYRLARKASLRQTPGI